MTDQVIVPPAAEPVTVAEVKTHLRVDHIDEDTLIGAYVSAARRWVETYTRRSLVRQSRRYRLDCFGGRAIELPNSPLRAVSAITYVDSNGDTQMWASTEYRVDAHSDIPRIEPAYGESWPTTRYVVNAVSIDYRAGYIAPFTANADTNTFTSAGHDLSDGDPVPIQNSGGSLPAGLDADTTYYVVNATTDTFQLATSEGGSAVAVTDAGSGTHFVGRLPSGIKAALFLLVAHLHENREAVSGGSINEVPFGVKALIDGDAVRSF